MGFSVGDGIVFGVFIYLVTWLLSKLFPLTFGGNLEDWLAIKREEIDRKHQALAKARVDEIERKKLIKTAREAAGQGPPFQAGPARFVKDISERRNPKDFAP